MKYLETNREGITTLTTSHSHVQQWELKIPLAASLLGLSLLALGSLGGFAVERAEANPANQNAPAMRNVTLIPENSNVALILKNTSTDKHIGNVKIEPTTNYLTLGLQGYAQCEPEVFPGFHVEGADWWNPFTSEEVAQIGGGAGPDTDYYYGQTFVHWGTVFLDGVEVQATEVLSSQPYSPTIYGYTWDDSVGYQNPWEEIPGANEPFLVPLASIKNGSENIRFRPVEVFSGFMDAWMQSTGGSRLEYLKQDRSFTVMRPVSLSAGCKVEVYPGYHGGYDTELVPVHVQYKGDPDLIIDPPPDEKAVPFQVTSALVTTDPYDVDYVGACPTVLDFRIDFITIGQGHVEYRLVDKLGAKGPINSVWTNGGPKLINFSKEVDVRSSDVFNPGEKAVTPPEGNDGSLGDKVAVLDPVKQNNSWRVEIVSPNSMTSSEHFYYWTCFDQTIDGSPDGYSVEADEPEGEGHVTVTGRVAN